MKKIGISIQNGLLAEGIIRMLHENGEFQPFRITSPKKNGVVSNCLLPLGSLAILLFCTWKKGGWGWDNFVAEANTGRGLKVKKWMRGYITFVLPLIILALFVIGIVTKFA